jgi:membrane-bound ClpP family serine protease
MSAMYKFCWVLWIGGTILILASWVDVVSPTVGWVGFAIALIGTLLSFVAQKQPLHSESKSPKAGLEDQTPSAE